MAQATFTVTVDYDPDKTDAESIATALDILMETALSTPDIFEDYGNPSVGAFYPRQVEFTAMTMQPESNGISFDCNGVRVTATRSKDGSVVVTVDEATGENDDTGLTGDKS